ncbi:MAG: orotidine-5'-phosphate decarboxylase [candidate division Zixibacteria bacterium]|nr:orotidine-5'-phosphate decarboxylase [candidate division Zixibacteria bacterium]
MNALDKLLNAQSKAKSMICLGLDLDPKRMPSEYTRNAKGMFDFALQIVEATKDVVCAYKPNLAFYESYGYDGISLLRMIVDRIPKDVPVIIDAKRGDIGNTASHYAKAVFEGLGGDWVTLSPYMGYDSLRPFLEYKDKGVFILCLTSNSGSKDFQMLDVSGKPLYHVVAEKVAYWNKTGNCGLVIGATAPEQLKEIRAVADDMPLLIPGVGAQGGSLEQAAEYGTDGFNKPAVINVSRSVLYASKDQDFATKARAELIKLNSAVSHIRGGDVAPPSEPVSPGSTSSGTVVSVSAELSPEEPAASVEPLPQPPALNNAESVPEESATSVEPSSPPPSPPEDS